MDRRLALGRPVLCLLLALGHGAAFAGKGASGEAASVASPAAPATGTGILAGGSHGTFGTSIDVELPQARGNAPALSLVYGSSSGKGVAGVGWTVAGTSSIQRRGRGNGTPQFDDSDVYYLDGMELVRCDLIYGPEQPVGCQEIYTSSYVQYTTRVRSGLRIAQIPYSSNWLVWRQDGTLSYYEAKTYTRQKAISPQGQVTGWLLNRVRNESKGVMTTYEYRDARPGDAVNPMALELASITYGNYPSVYYRVDLSHVTDNSASTAVGDYSLAHDDLRLTKISVTHVTSAASRTLYTYDLGYDKSPTTGRWLLTSVSRKRGPYDQLGEPFVFHYDSQDLRLVQGSPAPEERTASSTFPASEPGAGRVLRTANSLELVLPANAVDNVRHFSTDLNGDGLEDHVVAFWGGTAAFLQPYLAQRDGTYESGMTYQVTGYFPSDQSPFFLGDFDHNGQPDFLVVYNDRAMVLYYYDSYYHGFFNRPPSTIIPDYDYTNIDTRNEIFATGDLNHDGKDDLVRVRWAYDGNLKVILFADRWYGRGDGTFEPRQVVYLSAHESFSPDFLYQQYVAGRSLRDVLQVKIANGALHYLTLLGADAYVYVVGADGRGGRTGSFSAPSAVPVASIQWEQVLVDGRNESVFFYPGAGTGALRPRNEVRHGLGGYPPPPAATIGAVTNTTEWTVVDLDRDGRLDFLTLGSASDPCASGSRTLYGLTTVPSLNQPTAHEIVTKPMAYPAIPGNACVPDADTEARRKVESVFVGDVDGDGSPDIGSWLTTGVTFRNNQGYVCAPGTWRSCASIATFQFTPQITYSPTWPQDVAAWRNVDVDGDRDMDLVRLTDMRPGLRIETRLRSADGSLTWVAPQNAGFSSLPSLTPGAFQIVDLNGDGRQDLIQPRYEKGPYDSVGRVRLLMLTANGDGTFAAAEETHPNAIEGMINQRRWHAMDQDGDGKSDLVFIDSNSYSQSYPGCPFYQSYGVRLWSSTSTGFYEQPWVNYLYSCWRAPDAVDLRTTDVDGDGRQDLVGAWNTNGGTYTYTLKSYGYSGIMNVLGVAGDRAESPKSWQVARMNGDAIPDLVSISADRLQVLLGQGDGTFEAKTLALSKCEDCVAQRPFVTDWDGDAVDDLVIVKTYAVNTVEQQMAACYSEAGTCDLACASDTCPAPGRVAEWTELYDRVCNPNVEGYTEECCQCRGHCYYDVYQPCTHAVTPVQLASHVSAFVVRETSAGLTLASGTGVPIPTVRETSLIAVADLDGDLRADIERREFVESGPVIAVSQWFRETAVDHMVRLTRPGGAAIEARYDTVANLGEQKSDPAAGCRLASSGGFLLRSITVSPGATSVAPPTITYSYKCPAYLKEQHASGGWKKVTETGGAINRSAAVTESIFKITDACGAQVDTSTTYELGAGFAGAYRRSSSMRHVEYENPGTGRPFRCNPASDVAMIVDAEGNTESSGSTFRYDRYGQVDLRTEYRDLASGDAPRVTATTRSISSNPYIVTVNEETVSQGGHELSATRYCYDQWGSYATCTPASYSGMLTSVQQKDDHAVDAAHTWVTTETFQYDYFGSLTARCDAEGHCFRFEYQHNGWTPAWHPSATVNAAGHRTTFAFDEPTGRILSQIDPNGVQQVFTYDDRGRPTGLTVKDATGAVVSHAVHEYPTWSFTDADGSVRTLDSVVTRVADGTPDGMWSQTFYDGLGRIVRRAREHTGGTAVSDISFADASENPYTVESFHLLGTSGQPDWLYYDYLGRPTRTLHPDGSETRNIYSANRVTHLDELGRSTSMIYDTPGRLRRVDEIQDGASGDRIVSTSYDYDGLDRLVATSDPLGNTTTWTLSSLGLKLDETDTDRGTIRYAYHPDGSLMSTEDALGNVIEYTYDALDRPLTITENGVATFRYWYDDGSAPNRIGRLSWVEDLASATCSEAMRFTYDALGRPLTRARCLFDDAAPAVIHQSYDLAGRLKTVRYPGPADEVVSYDYDDAGRVKSVAGYVDDIVYDAAGRMTSMELANGVTETYAFDPVRGWLDTQTISSAGVVLRSTSYKATPRLANGLIRREQTTTTHPMGVSEDIGFVYDKQNRLVATTGSRAESFSYDDAGGLASKWDLGTYDRVDALGHGTGRRVARIRMSTPGVEDLGFEHDVAGNLTRMSRLDAMGAPRPSVTNEYGWDAWNRLASVTTPQYETTYFYDVFGARIGQKTRATGSPTATLRREYFPEYETDDAGGVVKHVFVNGRRIASKDQTDATSYYHVNALGSTVIVTDAAGEPEEFLRYDSFGARLGTPAGDSARGFTFTGARVSDKTFLPGLGNSLIHMGARFYDPVVGSFISADSILADVGTLGHRYTYAGGNPIMLVDPSGHEACSPGDYDANPCSTTVVDGVTYATTNERTVIYEPSKYLSMSGGGFAGVASAGTGAWAWMESHYILRNYPAIQAQYGTGRMLLQIGDDVAGAAMTASGIISGYGILRDAGRQLLGRAAVIIAARVEARAAARAAQAALAERQALTAVAKSVNPFRGKINCSDTALAFEMQMRGVKSFAGSDAAIYTGEKLVLQNGKAAYESTASVAARYSAISKSVSQGTAADMEVYISQLGTNGRAIVVGANPGSGTAKHAFNVVVTENAGVVMVDPTAGVVVNVKIAFQMFSDFRFFRTF